jgi:hypothetical protein
MIEAAIPGASDLSDLQKEAVARHYGAPSGLLDVTCEPEVAAVFAAKASTESEVGYIYAINLVELLSLAGASTSGRIRGGISWPCGPRELRKFDISRRIHRIHRPKKPRSSGSPLKLGKESV